jgi:hypothetical protein
MDEPPFICPYCDTELKLPDHVWYYTCDHCRQRLDLMSQFAYLRGLDAFKEGQELMDSISPRKRRRSNTTIEKESMTLFMQAYSSLQVAFKADLEDLQRMIAVEMMNSMAEEFMKRGLFSPLEVNYWNSLMVEQTAHNEFDRLREKLSDLKGPLAFIKRWRWKNRQKQLVESLAKLDQKIKSLEQQIQFVDFPHARNRKWRPFF